MLAGSLLLILATITSPIRANPAADAVADGPHFRVTVHFEDDRVAKQALEAAESAWPIATVLFGAPAIEADKPLEVHLYRSVEDYEKADQQFGGGHFKENLCFTSDATGAAYIQYQPELTDAVRERIGLTTMTRELIAHEATHVICNRAWPNAPTLPKWLDEGSATWVCEQALLANKWVKSADDDPMLARPAVLVKRLAADKKLPGFGLIFDDLLGDLPFYERYAVWEIAFRFLHDGKRAAALTKIVTEAGQMGGGPDHGARIAAVAREALGGDKGLAACDKEFAKYVRDLAPRWDEVYRSLSTNGEAWIQTAFGDTNAIDWQTADVGADKYELSGEVEVFAGPKQQMNLLLGRLPSGFVQVSFVGGASIVVFEYDNRRLDGKDWKRIGGVDLAGSKPNTSTPFKVKVSRSKISIDVDGKNVGTFEVADHPLQGAWGVGALEGSAGAWRKVTLKKS